MNSSFWGRRAASLFVASAVSLVAANAVTFDLGVGINGAIPDGSAPYATATIVDNGADSVLLTMLNNAPEANFIVRFTFNLKSNIDVSFAHSSGNVASSATDGPDHSDGHPSMQAGLWDIVFAYPTSNTDVNRFMGGENSAYVLTGTGLDETDFVVANDEGYISAARFQGISEDRSGTVGLVPEPASMAALAIGAVALLRRRRKA